MALTVAFRAAARLRILSLREWLLGLGERPDDALFGGVRLRRVLVGHRAAQAQGGPLSIIGEFDLDIVEAGRGAMLDGHDDLVVAPAQVQVAVAPGVEFRRTAKRLAGSGGSALAGVVDEHHGGREAALQIAQEPEDGGDVGDGILVDAMQAHQGVEDEQAWPDALDGLVQALAVVAVVEAQDGDIDDGDVEGVEVGAGGAGDALQASAHDVPGVLGGEHQDRSALVGFEASQARDAGGD